MLKPLQHTDPNGSINENHRTEDIHFSPSGRILATAATTNIFLYAINTQSRPVQIGRCTELRSASLSNCHGIAFLSEDVIVVANRAGHVTFYRIPDVNDWQDHMTVEPIHQMKSVWFGTKGTTRDIDGRQVQCGPGSMRVHGNKLIVSCNNLGTVTAHPYQFRNGIIETGEGTVIAQEGIEIPDAAIVSRDGRWMAVSDHHNQRVMIYEYESNMKLCELRDIDLQYPHGACFDRTGRTLYVADAGTRYVHVFVSSGGWNRSADSSDFKILAVEMDTFRKTKEAVAEKYRALEGGIKGLDIDPTGRFLATTCRHQILRFFEIPRSIPSLLLDAWNQTSSFFRRGTIHSEEQFADSRSI